MTLTITLVSQNQRMVARAGLRQPLIVKSLPVIFLLRSEPQTQIQYLSLTKTVPMGCEYQNPLMEELLGMMLRQRGAVAEKGNGILFKFWMRTPSTSVIMMIQTKWILLSRLRMALQHSIFSLHREAAIIYAIPLLFKKPILIYPNLPEQYAFTIIQLRITGRT